MTQGTTPKARQRVLPKRAGAAARTQSAAATPQTSNAFDEMAHQLSQPLATIVAFVRGTQLRIRTNQLASEDLERALESVAQEALRAGEILRALREMMRESHP